jgi:dipeptidyl aminopeptidase/acylaminoacyl peptidase
MPNAGVEGNAVVLGSLDGEKEEVLLKSPAQAEYAAGHVVYVKERALMARPFDAKKRVFTGDGFPIAEKVLVLSVTSGIAAFSASEDVLAMLTSGGEPAVRLQWLDRDGTARATLGAAADYVGPRLSPDGSRLAVIVRDPSYGQDVWVFDVARGVGTRFTTDPAIESSPAFSADGRTLFFSSNRRGHHDLYARTLDGTGAEESILSSGVDKYPALATPDGRALVYTEDAPDTKSDVMILPLAGDRTPQAFLKTPFIEYAAALSPDGRWLVYGSDQSGRNHLYVTSFPRPGRTWQLSAEEAVFASWSADGKEIVTESAAGALSSVAVRERDGALALEPARPLFTRAPPPVLSPYSNVDWSAAPDHKRFLARVRGPTPGALVDVMLHWTASVRRAR